MLRLARTNSPFGMRAAMRLDKYISQTTDYSRKDVKRLIRMGAITVDGANTKDAAQHIGDGQIVELDGVPLAKPGPRYFMMHKPSGYVSVTKDSTHPTVLELLDEPNPERLQIAGRLDIDTTGLLLITDDGQWNHAITAPNRDCDKEYYVTLADGIAEDTGARFAEGVMLDGELRATLPATLKVLYSNEAMLTIKEGRYHQVKRMFAAVGNRVTELHRTRVGAIRLDENLEPGEYRALTAAEINSVMSG